MDDTYREHYRKRRGVAKLWLAALAAPIGWTIQLQTVYGSTPYLCRSIGPWLPYAVTVLAIALAIGGMRLSYESWNAVGRSTHSTGADVTGRTRLFALVGLGGSAFFLIVILVQSLPIFILGPCDS
jgi:hypothetical protein